jgi:hypothetical protein
MNIPENSTSRYQTHTFFDTLVLCPLPNTSSSRQNFVINFGTLSFNFIKKMKNSYEFNFDYTPFFIFIIMFSLLYHSHHVIRIRCSYCHPRWPNTVTNATSNEQSTIQCTKQKDPFFTCSFFVLLLLWSLSQSHRWIFWVLSDFFLLRAMISSSTLL